MATRAPPIEPLILLYRQIHRSGCTSPLLYTIQVKDREATGARPDWRGPPHHVIANHAFDSSFGELILNLLQQLRQIRVPQIQSLLLLRMILRIGNRCTLPMSTCWIGGTANSIILILILILIGGSSTNPFLTRNPEPLVSLLRAHPA